MYTYDMVIGTAKLELNGKVKEFKHGFEANHLKMMKFLESILIENKPVKDTGSRESQALKNLAESIKDTYKKG